MIPCIESVSPREVGYRHMDLSIVVPIYNEASVLRELARRCLAAGDESGLSFEVILADDCSTDETPVIFNELRKDARLRCIRTEKNQGQFPAIKEGLRHARGNAVVVLDGDLQDPPEIIPELIGMLRGDEKQPVVFAVKSSRDDPAWFMPGQCLFHFLQSAIAGTPLPRGAGSYCAMRRETALRVSRTPLRHANLPSVLAAMRVAFATVPYKKEKRYDRRSRIGFMGLVWEAVAALALTGALARLAWIAAFFFAFTGGIVMYFIASATGMRCGAALLCGAFLISIAGLCLFVWSKRTTDMLREMGAVAAREPGDLRG